MAINRDKVNAAAIKLLQAGKYDKAIAELRKLVEDDPSDIRTILKIGDTYVKMGARAEAIQSYERVAQIYSDQGFYLKAVAVFKQMLRVDGNLPDVHLKLAELYQQLGLTSDCLQHYQQVAIFYEQSGRAKDSLAILKRMVDLDPDNLPSRIKLAELFAQQGLMPDAVSEFRSAAAYLIGQQREDDFLRVGERLIFFDPGALDMTRQLAEIYLRRGDAKLALGKLQLCFKADPRNLETLTLIAKAFLDMQQVPKTVSVYKEIARIYESNAQMGEARGYWEQVLNLAPGDEDAETALGMRGGAVPAAAATAAAEEAAPPSGDPQEEQIQRMLTETDVYVKYGLKDKAAEHIQKILALRPDHIVALEKLRALYQKTGERLRLRMTLEQLVRAAHNQGDERAGDWQQELAALGGGTAQPAPAARAASAQPRSTEGEIILVDEDAALLEAVDAIAAAAPAALAEEEAFDPDAADLPLDEPAEAVVEDEGAIFAPDEPADYGQESLPADEPAEEFIGGEAAVEEELLLAEEPADDAAQAAPAPMDFEMSPGTEARQSPRTLAPVVDDMADALSSQDADQLVRQALMDLEAQQGSGIETPSGDFGLPPMGGDASFDDAPEYTTGIVQAGGLSEIPSATNDAILEDDDDQVVPGPRTTAVPGMFAASGSSGFTELDPSQLDDGPVSEIGAEVEAALASNAESEAYDDFDGATIMNPAGGDLVDRVKADLAGRGATIEDAAATSQPLPPEFGIEDRSPRFEDPTLDIERGRRAPVTAVTANAFESAPPTASQEGAFESDQVQPSMDASMEEAPAPRTAGKLGFEGKGVGFENDPANTFFPDELEEAEFFISQGLLDEAREIVQSILDDVPESARAQHMLARIEAQEQGLPEPPAPWEQKIFDEVASELENLGANLEAPADAPPVGEMQVSVEEVLSQFKKGIAETVAEDDAATHYDLGIAYREMGLLDDAIGEFLLASRAPAKCADARYLIGLTHIDKGSFDDALDAFNEALAAPVVKPEQKAASEYQRGVCYTTLGRHKDAHAALKRAKSLGSTAADLDRRLQKAAEDAANEDDGVGAGRGGDGRPKNIDYV